MDTITLLSSVLVGGGATVLATQLLKSKYIPVPAQAHPQWTAGIVSLVAAIIAEYQAGIKVDLHNVPGLVALFVGTLWVAISVYNHLSSKPV